MDGKKTPEINYNLLLPPIEELTKGSRTASPFKDSNNSQTSFLDSHHVEKSPYQEISKVDLKLVIFMVNTLIACGVRPEDIGVITPLNYEKNYISNKLNVR